MSTPGTSTSIEVNVARAHIYRWFSRMLIQPTDHRCSGRVLREALAALPLNGLQPIPEVAQERLTSEFRQIFSHNLTPDCPPYETQYGSSHIFWQSQQLADIAGFYKAFGLALDNAAHERVDHIAVELEFMGYLALKEAYALEGKKEAQAKICQDAQRKFLKDHLGRWLSPFRDRIQHKLPESAYANLINTLAKFVEWDCQRLAVQPEVLSFDASRQAEAPVDNGCLPCGGPGGRPACA